MPIPPLILSMKVEDDFKARIAGMQCQGLSVCRHAILFKGNELYHPMIEKPCQVV
jgi:hypothetical protein